MANESNLNPPWPKGTSGNPGGRPKEKLITDAIRKRLGFKVKEFLTAEEIARFKFTKDQAEFTVAELMADRIIRMGLAGNSDGARIFREIMDRIEGRVPLPLTGVDGGFFELHMHNHIARPNRDPKKVPKPDKTKVQ